MDGCLDPGEPKASQTRLEANKKRPKTALSAKGLSPGRYEGCKAENKPIRKRVRIFCGSVGYSFIMTGRGVAKSARRTNQHWVIPGSRLWDDVTRATNLDSCVNSSSLFWPLSEFSSTVGVRPPWRSSPCDSRSSFSSGNGRVHG